MKREESERLSLMSGTLQLPETDTWTEVNHGSVIHFLYKPSYVWRSPTNYGIIWTIKSFQDSVPQHKTKT